MTSEENSDERIDILLVEPNEGDSRLFTESFRDAKLANTLHTVTDGESALDFLQQRGDYAAEPRPDLVLLEPRLPGKSGGDVLEELKHDSALREIPVVVLTGSEVEEEIARSHGLEADHYIQKPIEPTSSSISCNRSRTSGSQSSSRHRQTTDPAGGYRRVSRAATRAVRAQFAARSDRQV